MESFELDVLMTVSRNQKSFSKEKQEQKAKEAEDFIHRLEKEIKEDARLLLRAISNRDQILSAGRRAFQRLDRECKEAIFYSLKKLSDKEKETNDTKTMVLEKLESSVKSVNVEDDINQFVLNHQREGGALELNAQALTLLGDQLNASKSMTGSGSSSESEPVSSSSSSSSSSRRPSSTFSLLGLGSHKFSSSPLPSPSTVPVVSSPTPPVPGTDGTDNNSTWEFTAFLSLIFYAAENNPSAEGQTVSSSEDPKDTQTREQVLKDAHRKTRMINNDLKMYDISTLTAQEVLNIETNKSLNEAVTWLCSAVKTQKGRDEFVSELNQFRSRKVSVFMVAHEMIGYLLLSLLFYVKVELSAGFDALGVVLWNALSRCQSENDVRTAKVIMMLSQVC
jgi:hypothetical protein